MAEASEDIIPEKEVADEEKEEEAADEGKVDHKDDDAPAPVRKSAAYFVGKRQGIKEGREKAKNEDVKEDDVELTSQAREAIRKELEPIVAGMKESADDIEVREYLSGHPEHAKYEKAIRRRMDAWKEVPVSEIAKTVAFGEEAPKRAEKKQEAEARAKGRNLGGSSGRAEEATLPAAKDHAEIYKRMQRGEQLNLETGEWEPAKSR